MANQQLTGSSSLRQLWDDEIRRVINLAEATLKQNAELESRVADLELQLAFWKQHSVETTETHKVQIANHNRQTTNMDVFRMDVNPLIFCVLNGDEIFFSQQLLVHGFQGGQSAARQLTKAIAECLSKEGVQLYGRLSFSTTLFINKAQLSNMLIGRKICTQDQLDGFLAGFTQYSPRILTIDICCGEGGTDAKIKEYLQTYTYLPQTFRVFCGGWNNLISCGLFDALDADGLLEKLVLLHSRPIAELSAELHPYKIPYLDLEGLLVDHQFLLGHLSKSSTPVPASSFSRFSANGGLVSPQSPVRVNGRFVDPSLPLHKQNPPPCNEHYLMTCSKGSGQCKYSHDYALTPEQLASLASNAKKAPCNWLKNELQCPYGDKCCWGHVCPNGTKCFHLSKGKCWFKGEGMHDHPPTSFFKTSDTEH